MFLLGSLRIIGVEAKTAFLGACDVESLRLNLPHIGRRDLRSSVECERGALATVAWPTQYLQVVHRRGTAHSYRDDVVELQLGH